MSSFLWNALGPEPQRRSATLYQLAAHRAETAPALLAYTYLADGETAEESLTYRDLDRMGRDYQRDTQRDEHANANSGEGQSKER